MPVRKVTDPSVLQQLNSGSAIPNPMFPGQMQGQGLNNVGQDLQNRERSATLPYAAPKAAAQTSEAQTNAGVAAATAPAEIRQKTAAATKGEVEATAAKTNLEVSGGADVSQAKNAGFYARALKAGHLYDQTGVRNEPAGHALANAVLPDAIVNQFTGSSRQQAEAAQRDFISATLRYESGAAISPQEFENQRKIYFPQPGDSEETIGLKGQLRKNAIDALRVSAGPAAPMLEQGQVADYSGMVGGPQTDIAAGPTATELDPETGAQIDRLIRMGRPVQEIVAFAKSKGYDQVDAAAAIQAEQYAKQHPGYKGGFTQVTKQRPTTLRERISGSPLGAGVSAAGTAATVGLNDEAAGALNAIGGGDYTEGRDAYNASKHLLADEHPVADFAGTAIGAGAGMAGLSRLPGTLGEVLSKGGNIGADLSYGAAYGAGENNENRLGGALLGGAAGAGGNLAGRAAAKTLGGLVSPSGGKLAPLYEMGVRPSIGQRAGGLVNNFEEKFQSLPFVGDAIQGTRQNARDQFQVGLFNDALGEIGEQLPKGMGPGHDPHAFAQKAFRQAYDAAKSGMTAVADGGLATDLGSVQRSVLTLKPDSQNVFNKVWADSVGRRFAGRSLTGAAFKDATSELEKKIAAIRNSNSGDGELADALQDAVDAIQSSAMRNSPPEAVAAMEAADRGYAKLVQLEDASKRAGGDAATFSPKQFESAVKNTSTGVRKRSYLAGKALNSDVAEAGLSLSDVVSNSGTIDRYAPAAALMGLGFVEPKTAALMGLYGLLNAPGIRKATTAAMAPRGGKAKTLGDLIRKQTPAAGTLGSAAGIGLIGPR